jgi:hypothetical protein
MGWDEVMGWGFALLTLLLLGVIGTALLRASGEAAKDLGQAAKDVGKGAGQAMQGAGMGTGQALAGLGTGLGQTAAGVGTGLGQVISGTGRAVGTVGSALGTLAGGVGRAASGLGQAAAGVGVALLGGAATGTVKAGRVAKQAARATQRGTQRLAGAARTSAQKVAPYVAEATQAVSQAAAATWARATGSQAPSGYAWIITDPSVAEAMSLAFDEAGVAYQWQQNPDTGEWSVVIHSAETNLDLAGTALDGLGLEIREPGRPVEWFEPEPLNATDATAPTAGDKATQAPEESTAIFDGQEWVEVEAPAPANQPQNGSTTQDQEG